MLVQKVPFTRLLLSLFILNIRGTSGTTVKPHIVLILADDLGFDDVSYRGSNEFLTPNIDALGYHGSILDRFYAPAVSTPSRATLLTGLYPIHTGTQTSTLSNGAKGGLPMNLTLMPEFFQRAGYSTQLIGKWNLGHARREQTPSHRGFDHHFGFWGSYIDHYQRLSKAPPPCNQTIGYDFWRDMKLDCTRMGEYVTELFTEEAERIIASHSNGTDTGKPLFLLMAHALPHYPLQAPQEEVQKFAYIKNPARRTYAAMVSILDRSIGRIVRSLERSSMLENTIVIFSSDNGGVPIGHSKNSGSNWPLKGQKDSPWEGGIRLPAVVWSPLLQTGRQRIFRQSIYIGDWLPTLAAAAGIELPRTMSFDGRNMWPFLVDASKEVLSERAILHSLDPKRHFVSYMRGPWKYINGTTSSGLYDNVLTYREIYDVDPRSQRYVIEVRNSPVSKALSKFDVQRLTQHRIETLRQAAAVQCVDRQRGCNALIEECLFNIEMDPCEQQNLIYEPSSLETLRALRAEIDQLAQSSLPAIDISCRNVKESDPAVNDCVWRNFLELPNNSVRRECSHEGTACEAAGKV